MFSIFDSNARNRYLGRSFLLNGFHLADLEIIFFERISCNKQKKQQHLLTYLLLYLMVATE